jgi:hypothetical protein
MIKRQKEVTKYVGINVFLTFLKLVIEGSGSVHQLTDPDPGGPKTYGFYGSGSATLHTLPTVQIPEPCVQHIYVHLIFCRENSKVHTPTALGTLSYVGFLLFRTTLKTVHSIVMCRSNVHMAVENTAYKKQTKLHCCSPARYSRTTDFQ